MRRFFKVLMMIWLLAALFLGAAAQFLAPSPGQSPAEFLEIEGEDPNEPLGGLKTCLDKGCWGVPEGE